MISLTGQPRFFDSADVSALYAFVNFAPASYGSTPKFTLPFGQTFCFAAAAGSAVTENAATTDRAAAARAARAIRRFLIAVLVPPELGSARTYSARSRDWVTTRFQVGYRIVRALQARHPGCQDRERAVA